MSKAKTQQKRHAVPAALVELIDLANSVPPTVDLPAPQGRVREIVEMLGTEDFSDFRRLSGPIAPDTFLTKLVGQDVPVTYKGVIGNYIRLRDGRNWLRQAALIGEQSRTVRIRYLMPMLSAQTNDRGELEFNVDPLVEALKGVEASRIRVCPICRAIFWASRKDQPCCSNRCGKRRRTRRWREKYPNRYKFRRLGIQPPADLESHERKLSETERRPPEVDPNPSRDTNRQTDTSNRGTVHVVAETAERRLPENYVESPEAQRFWEDYRQSLSKRKASEETPPVPRNSSVGDNGKPT